MKTALEMARIQAEQHAARDPDRARGKAFLRARDFARQRGLYAEVGGRSAAAALAGRAESLDDATRTARVTSWRADGYAAGIQRARQRRRGGSGPESAPAHPSPAGLAPAPPARWVEMGPTRGIALGQTYGRGPRARIDCTGRVSALAVDPADPSHVLAGAGAGGIWESRDAGATWAPRSDDQATLTTGALLFDPSRPGRAYAGTGEGNDEWRYALLGMGVLQSSDGGTTWSPLAVDPFRGSGFYELALDPVDASVLYGGTTKGLFRSDPGGAVWNPIRAETCWSLSLARPDPGAPGVELLAATPTGLHASADRGVTWAPVPFPSGTATWVRLAVRHVPGRPDLAFAFGQPKAPPGAPGAPPPELWLRRADGTWGAVPLPALDAKQAAYDWLLELDPQVGAVYVGAIDLFRGLVDPGGTWSWENLSTRVNSTDGESLHPDQHCLVVTSGVAGRLWVGNDGGVYRSDDAGARWAACVRGLGITEVEYIAQQPTQPRWLLAGTQDNGTLRYREPEGWEHVADGDGGACAASLADPSCVYHTYYSLGIQRSRVGGDYDSWQDVLGYLPAANFYPPVQCRNDLLVQADLQLWISPNRGDSWAALPLPSDTWEATALTLPRETQVVVGTYGGAVYTARRTPSGFWRLEALGRPLDGPIGDVAHDPAQPDRLWVGTTYGFRSQRVMLTRDGGAHWDDATGDLSPDVPVNAIAVDPRDGRRVWLGTDAGVYETVDEGVHWTPLGVGLPNVIVGDLLLHAGARRLRAGTRSRGVWEIAV